MNQTVSKINATERTSQDALVEFFVAQTGITSPTQVAEMLRVPVETARRWMRRYRMNRSDMNGHIRPLNQDSDKACRFDRSDMTKPCRFDRSDLNAAVPSPPLKKKGLPHTPSKEKTTPPLPPTSARERDQSEIAGLNGSTGYWVEKIAESFSQWAPDHESARRILAGMSEAYGPDALSMAVIDFDNDVSSGSVRASAKLLSRYCQTAKEKLQNPQQAKGKQAPAYSAHAEALAVLERRRQRKLEGANNG